MNRTLLSALLLSTLAGCSLFKVSGVPGADAEPEPEPSASPESSGAPTTPNEDKPSPAATPKEPTKTKGDLDSEAALFSNLQRMPAITGQGEITVKTALDGFSSADLRQTIEARYKQAGEEPKEEMLARADKAKQDEKEAAAAAAKKREMPKSAGSDPAAEKAIAANFLVSHKGAEIKKVVMIDADWKKNFNGLAVRNRYKNAMVLIAVKGADFCLRVPANAVQAAIDGGFSKEWKHDTFDRGVVVPCE